MSFFASTVLAALVANPNPGSASLLIWSDLGGEFPPALLSRIDSLRKEADQERKPLLALDGGNSLSGSDMAFITRSAGPAKVLEKIHPDAAILGAADFVWPRSQLDSLQKLRTYPLLTANLRDALTTKPYGGKSSSIWDFDGFRLGVIGVVDPNVSSTDRPIRTTDLRSEDAALYVQTAIEELRAADAKVVILLSHAGPEFDQNLGQEVPGLDLVVSLQADGRDTVYKQDAVWYARLSGGPNRLHRLELSPTETGIQVVSVPVPLAAKSKIQIPTLPIVDSLQRLVKSKTDSVIDTLKEAWPIPSREGNLGNWVADALRMQSGSNVALVPVSALKAGLPKGKVTVGDLWKVLGPAQQVSVFELPGSELERLLRRQMSRSTEYLFLSGASCTSDSSAFGGSRGVVLIEDKPILPSERYKVAIPQALRDRPYEITGFSYESLSPEYIERWDRDLLLEQVRTFRLKTTLGRVPPMWGRSR
ncbi:MAG: bifunctional metallophosphatase/5'-nucleotidase [Fibrobacterota bacterium]|nr:bifunctional metallophosphatase/5'-nucleotidase [Fibrobacterota bacterium]QQS03081.1 MAG: bifunctional metallophosphatase/5'-nucleotidase [Fibrobacterota bacterium]